LRKSVAVLALIAFAANASSSKADTVFTVNGTIANVNPYGGTDSLTGTVTIDTTAGTATAWDVNVGLSPGLSSYFGTSSLVFDSPTTTPLVSGGVELSGLASGGLSAELDLFVPVNTLVGYSGGSLIDISAGSPPISQLVAPGGEGSYGTLTSGTLSSAVVSPEPATVTLLATAFLACGAYGLFRRRRRGATETTPVC
jgi:hypothetical protein